MGKVKGEVDLERYKN